ncbi:hypothetical protein [Streptomyces griseofuscus]
MTKAPAPGAVPEQGPERRSQQTLHVDASTVRARTDNGQGWA